MFDILSVTQMAERRENDEVSSGRPPAPHDSMIFTTINAYRVYIRVCKWLDEYEMFLGNQNKLAVHIV